MQSIHDIVEFLNEGITLQKAKVYGIADFITRDGKPVPSWDGKYIGVDDIHEFIIYHKLVSITNTLTPGSGYGDSRGDQVNLFQMQMIVFNNSKIRQTDAVLILQANTPRKVNSEIFKAISINYTGAITSSPQVWTQEYGSLPYELKRNQSLTQINYTVQAVYKDGCFVECACNKN